jgi:hypothetical protein
MDLALQNPWFKKNRFQQQQAKKLNVGGSGLGHRERPGLGLGSKGGRGQESSISTVLGGRGASGPQSDRVATMKAAFANQFKSNFVSAVSTVVPVNNKNNTGWTTSATLDFIPNSAPDGSNPAAPGTSKDEPRPKKKSRWND